MFNKKNKKTIELDSTQSFLPIKRIFDGIIQINDDEFVKILEISPINFETLSSAEKNSIIISFGNLLRTIPYDLQLKVISRKTNANKIIENLQKDFVNETNEQCKKMQEETINLIKSLSSSQGVEKVFLLAFKYIAPYNATDDTIIEEINKIVYDISVKIKSCGNEVVFHDNEDVFTHEMLYQILNRKKCENIPFSARVNEIAEKYKSAYISDKNVFEKIHASDFIAPKWIDASFTDCFIVDDKYYKFAFISSNGFPCVPVQAGWLSPIINAGEGIDMDVFLSKIPSEKVISKVSRKIIQNKSSLSDSQDTDNNYEAIQSTVSSGYYIKQGLAQGQELFYMNVLVSFCADSYKELMDKYTRVKSMLIPCDLNLKHTKYFEQSAFLSSLPFCSLDKYIYNKSKRNILTQDAASTFPFTSFELTDDDGIVLGINESNNSLVIQNIFDTSKYKNANMFILGTSGSGKTYTIQCLAMRMRQKGIPIYLIAPLKGHEYKRCCKNMGGQYIKISAGSDQRINIMEIRKNDAIDSSLIDGEIVNESLLSNKIQSLHVFFSLLVPNITDEERNILDDALVKTYADKGINFNNDSLYLENSNKFKTMPILEDLYNNLLTIEHSYNLHMALKKFVSGSAKSFNGQTNVNLDNDYTILDISNLQGNMLIIGTFIALDFVWDKAKENRIQKKAVFLDELWKLIGSASNPIVANYVLEIYKIIRGYGGSAIAATQDINDFNALENGKYGKGIISNSKTKIILNLEEDEANTTQKLLNLTDYQTSAVRHFERGHGILLSGNTNVLINFKATDFENSLITTDRSQLEKLVSNL